MIRISQVELKLSEVLTVLFIFSVGYGLLIKVAFYNFIGLPWLIPFLTPTAILYTTFFIFMQLLLGAALGIYLAKKFRADLNPNYILYFGLFLLISGIPAFFLKFVDSIFLIQPIGFLISLHFTLYCSFQTYLIESNRISFSVFGNNSANELTAWYKSSPIFITFLFFVLLIMMPVYFGSIEASKVLKNTGYFFNQVILKADDSKWFLIENAGEKLIIKKNDPNHVVYKVVEFKDIKELTPHQSMAQF